MNENAFKQEPEPESANISNFHRVSDYDEDLNNSKRMFLPSNRRDK